MGVSPEVRSHLSLAFPGSDAIITRPDEDTKENSKSFENFEQVQIEIEPVENSKSFENFEQVPIEVEPVEDKEEDSAEDFLRQEVSSDVEKKDNAENLTISEKHIESQIEHSKNDTNATPKALDESK